MKSGEKAIFLQKKKQKNKQTQWHTLLEKKKNLSMITVKSDVTHIINWI